MRRVRFHALAIWLGLIGFQAAHAGLPLKGVDVKLGKNPGGTVAARTTDAGGIADFGVVPAGNYSVVIVPKSTEPLVHVVITGSGGGVVTRDFQSRAAERAAPIAFATNRHEAIRISVEGGSPVGVVRIKSHSNSTNN